MTEVSEAPPPRLLPIGDEQLHREATVIRRRSSLLSSPRGIVPTLENSAPRPPSSRLMSTSQLIPRAEQEAVEEEDDEEEEEGTRTPPMPVLTPGECYREEEDMESSDESSCGWSPTPLPPRGAADATNANAALRRGSDSGPLPPDHNIPILEKIKRDLDTGFQQRLEQQLMPQQFKREAEPFEVEPSVVPMSVSHQPTAAKRKYVRKSRAKTSGRTDKQKTIVGKKSKKSNNAFDFDSDNELNPPLRSIKSKFTGPSKVSSKIVQTERRYLRSPYISMAPATSNSGDSFQIVNPALRGGDKSISTAFSYKPNVKIPSGDQLDSAHWVCAFCGRNSKFLALGSLYGPYIAGEEVAGSAKDATRDLLSELPLATVYKCGEDVKSALLGVSGKTLLKTNSNGALRLVIKATGQQSPQIPAPTITRVGRQTGRKQAKMAGAGATGKTCDGGAKKVSDAIMPPPAPVNNRVDCRVGEAGETWFHLECLLWAPGTFLRGDGKVGGLSEALKMSLYATCSSCSRVGAILSCVTRGCTNCYHFPCAQTAGAVFDEEQLTIFCSKHKPK